MKFYEYFSILHQFDVFILRNLAYGKFFTEV